MNLKNERGYTGIDIAISVIVLFIFISLIATLSYQFNRSAKEIQLKSEAIEIAVEEIESLKNVSFDQIEERKMENAQEIEHKTGFYRLIKVQDYADINPGKERNLVKKVTVQIKYMFQSKEQTIELSTILSKES